LAYDSESLVFNETIAEISTFLSFGYYLPGIGILSPLPHAATPQPAVLAAIGMVISRQPLAGS
jgi:hypothetical protein